ncbi:hypothetical protein OCF84_20740 (plasmid) [Shewanella xiamenensis]|uniref:Conjugal transfer protein TrbI n=1 Tax=Shewanella xiamenensis TaxID=332186 RepID=A0ABT6UFQ9_9GAMM|nr:hypothetical protein [Shewanella xiamenensis]MDI5833304.1 hypothetical protein [Shewanella xiamenensis]WHF57946.1 hypothetical protein OCF84_20740 [Shewanella xiamenensis]
MSASAENNLTNNPFKTMKKAWSTLPRSSKKIYKIVLGLICIFGYMVASNISSEKASSVQSKVSLPSSDDRERKQDSENTQLDYQMKSALKESEEQRQKDSLTNNVTYLPKMDNLELQPSSDIIVPPPKSDVDKSESKVVNKPEVVSDTDFALGRNNDRQVSSVRRMQDEEVKSKIQTRLSIYQALEQGATVIDGGGELYVRKFESKKTDDLKANSNIGNQASGTSKPYEDSNQIASSNRLTRGDVVIVQIDNYLNSDDNGKFVRMTMLEPIEGPIITGEYTRQGEFLNITTSSISYKGITKPFKGIVVTADGRMSAGAATSSDNHSFYRWSMLVLSGALSGIGEVYLGSGAGTDKIIKENGDIYETSRPGYETIAIGVGKGIGDRTASIAEKEFETPPTVILDPKEQSIWGVYVSETVDLEGFPLIDRGRVY